jgi:hypothetical protein
MNITETVQRIPRSFVRSETCENHERALGFGNAVFDIEVILPGVSL